jgi:hypothetical protein
MQIPRIRRENREYFRAKVYSHLFADSHHIMQEIKKIKKLSLANLAAFLCAFFAFIIIFSVFIGLIARVVREKETAGKLAKFIFINLGVDFLISLGAAIAVGIAAWVIGFLAAAFYNFIAKNIGGVKVEIIDEVGEAAVLKTEERKQELFKY